MNNKCQIESHSQRSLIKICLAVKCKGKRVCCSMCQTEFHQDHIGQMVDFQFLLDFLTTQSQKPMISPPKVKQAIKELNNVLKEIDNLTNKIKWEINRLGSDNLQTFCKNLGNTYNVFTEQIGNQQWNDLAQEILSLVELKNGQIIEKDSFATQLGKPYSHFMKQFSSTMTQIVSELQIVKQIINPNPFLKLTVPHVLKGHTNTVYGIDICEKRNLLVSGSRDNTVKLWNLQDYTLLKTYKSSNKVYEAVFSREGRFLAFCGENKIINLVELKDLKNNEIFSELKGHLQSITRLTFSNDETYLVSGSYDETVRFWNIQTKEELFKFDSESVVYGLAISGDNTLIASHTHSSGIKIWNFKKQQLLCTHDCHSYGSGIQFSNDQQMLVSSGEDGIIKLWSLKELYKGRLSLIKKFKTSDSSIQKVYLTSDSRFIISYSYNDCVKVIDSNTGEQVKVYKIQSKSLEMWEFMGLAITKKQNLIAYGERDKIMLWKSKG